MANQKASVIRTCYHEAGHAVAAFRQGIRFRYVTIEPEADSLGHVLMQQCPKWFRPDLDASERARLYAEKRVVINFAGNAAEARSRSRTNRPSWSSDRSNAADYVSPFVGNGRERDLYLAWLRERAKMLVTAPLNWSAVEGVAAQLLEQRTLSYDKVVAIIRDSVLIQLRASKGRKRRI